MMGWQRPFGGINMNETNKLETPLNANERYLHAVCVRLDALIHMFSSFLEVYAKQNNLATTSNTVTEDTSAIKPKKVRK